MPAHSSSQGCCSQCPWPHSRPLLIHASRGDSRQSQTHRQVWLSLFWGLCSFLLCPGAYNILLCPPRERVNHPDNGLAEKLKGDNQAIQRLAEARSTNHSLEIEEGRNDIKVRKLDYPMLTTTLSERCYLAGDRQNMEEKHLLPETPRVMAKGRNALLSPLLLPSRIAFHWLNLPRSQRNREPGKCNSLWCKAGKRRRMHLRTNWQFTRRLVDTGYEKKREREG